jgi:hypothetical protein
MPKANTVSDANSPRLTGRVDSPRFSPTRPRPPKVGSKAIEPGIAKRRVGRPGNVGIPQARTPEYRAYSDAKSRCQNPNHQNYRFYGARGTEFRFTSFAEFFAAVGGLRPSPRHALSRTNNKGHYEAGNIRWAIHRGRSPKSDSSSRGCNGL